MTCLSSGQTVQDNHHCLLFLWCKFLFLITKKKKRESVITLLCSRRLNHRLPDRRYLQSLPIKCIESSQETGLKIGLLTLVTPGENVAEPCCCLIQPCLINSLWNATVMTGVSWHSCSYFSGSAWSQHQLVSHSSLSERSDQFYPSFAQNIHKHADNLLCCN